MNTDNDGTRMTRMGRMNTDKKIKRRSVNIRLISVIIVHKFWKGRMCGSCGSCGSRVDVLISGNVGKGGKGENGLLFGCFKFITI